MMNHIRSSWNSDRVGNCFLASKSSVRKPRTRYLYAERHGNTVSVCNARGGKLYTVAFCEEVVSAIVKEGHLVVTTADSCVRTYGVISGKLISEMRPTPPAGDFSSSAFALAA